MSKRVLGILAFFMFFLSSIVSAQAQSQKNYPGRAVIEQEIENHKLVLASLKHLTAEMAQDEAAHKTVEHMMVFTRSSIISLEYLEDLLMKKAEPDLQKSVFLPAGSAPCVCNGEENCSACGEDGYVWISDRAGKEARCKKCQGSGKVDGQKCFGCEGSGWANASPTSPVK